jgi:hypothetical protein
LRYGLLFDALATHSSITQPTAGLLGMSTESRKRPESSSPEKLKARNKDKFRESAIAEPAK